MELDQDDDDMLRDDDVHITAALDDLRSLEDDDSLEAIAQDHQTQEKASIIDDFLARVEIFNRIDKPRL